MYQENEIVNKVTLRGQIRNIQPSHQMGDIEYSKAELIVPRKDGTEDVLDLRFKKFSNQYQENQLVELLGNVRSYSTSDNNKNKVQVYVFTYFDIPESNESNKVQLDGRVCKINSLYTTRSGKDVLHFVLANNIITDSGNKKINCYIPCTCYGKIAKELSACKVSDILELTGTLHSRQYLKALPDSESEIRTAYEVLIDSYELLI